MNTLYMSLLGMIFFNKVVVAVKKFKNQTIPQQEQCSLLICQLMEPKFDPCHGLGG